MGYLADFIWHIDVLFQDDNSENVPVDETEEERLLREEREAWGLGVFTGYLMLYKMAHSNEIMLTRMHSVDYKNRNSLRATAGDVFLRN